MTDVTDDAARLIGVPAADIDAVWPLVRPLIAAACGRSRGKFEADDIRDGLRVRDMQLWLAWNGRRHAEGGLWPAEGGEVQAVAVTEIVRHPRKACCRIRLCTGYAREQWRHHLATIERWARAQGCQAMELIARPGWARVLAPQGYSMTHVFLEKEI